jgi:hypothetical protein
MNESDFASQVEDLLTLFGWRWTHFRPAWSSKGYRTPIRGYKGFPDYVATHPVARRLLFIELKSDNGKPTPEQDEWLSELQECVKWGVAVDSRGKATKQPMTPSHEVYIWRPTDIDSLTKILQVHTGDSCEEL